MSDRTPRQTTSIRAAATRPGSAARRAAAPVLVCLALGTAAAGCGGSEDDATNQAADDLAEQIAEAGGQDAEVDIDSETGEVDVQTDDGEMSVGEDVALPDDFPSEIPLPDDYELSAAMTSSADGGWTITGSLPDASEASFDELVAGFTDAGWTTESDSSSDTGGGTASTALVTNDTWQVLVSVQVGVTGTPDSFSYLVSPAAG